MATPVAGPIVRSGSGVFSDFYQSGYRQAMPIDRPLEYLMYDVFGISQTESWDTDGIAIYNPPVKQADWSLHNDARYSHLWQHLFNSAYAKIQARASDRAGWAENIVQVNKTRRTVVERLEQLAHFAGAVRQRRFRDAARILRTSVPSGVSHRKAVSQNFLEYEYGVKPLISDVQSSMKILLSDPGVRSIHGTASEVVSSLLRDSTVSGSNPTFYSNLSDVTNGKLTVTCRANVRVSNPNVFLANQLGLIDLALPWKLIPFSFVVDWFINVEQVISSCTDWYGMELNHPHVTQFASGSRVIYSFVNLEYEAGYAEGHITRLRRESVYLSRTMSIPAPSLIVKPFKGFSLQRGLQAAALVLSSLGK